MLMKSKKDKDTQLLERNQKQTRKKSLDNQKTSRNWRNYLIHRKTEIMTMRQVVLVHLISLNNKTSINWRNYLTHRKSKKIRNIVYLRKK